MSVVLLTSDLAVISRVEGAISRLGKKMRIAADGLQAAECCHSEPTEQLIIDLSSPSLDIRATLNQLKSNEASAIHIIAFGPHVHEERLAAARDAGCDLVASRGQFFGQLDSILAGR